MEILYIINNSIAIIFLTILYICFGNIFGFVYNFNFLKIGRPNEQTEQNNIQQKLHDQKQNQTDKQTNIYTHKKKKKHILSTFTAYFE
jgi:hypothetical protein